VQIPFHIEICNRDLLSENHLLQIKLNRLILRSSDARDYFGSWRITDMARFNDCDTLTSPNDSASDKTTNNVNQSVRWQGETFKNSIDSMKPSDTGSAHLPSLSLTNGNSDLVSQIKDSVKTLEKDLTAFEQDIAKLQAQLNPSDTTAANPTTPPGDKTPTNPATPPGDSTPTNPATPPGDKTPTNPASPPGDTTPTNPASPPGDTTPTNPASPSGDTTPTNPASPPGDKTPTQPATPGDTTPTKPTNPGDPVAPGDATRPTIPAGDGSPGQWQQQTINGMKYDVLLPANYDPSKKYPTVLYLHQLDMGTDEPDLINEVNPWFNSPTYRQNNPSIVVMPLLDQSADPSGQTVNFGGVSNDQQAGETNAIAALKQVESNYSVDSSRVYVTGNSLGGIGTWDMLTKYNAVNGTNEKIFAAGMPLAGNDYAAGGGNPDPNVVNQLKDVPIWAIHGADDQQVPNSWDRSLSQSLANDPNFHYTELPMGHDVWDTVYPDQTYWNWLFSQQSA
jgi:predicted esterase